jgi:hypothetical protein
MAKTDLRTENAVMSLILAEVLSRSFDGAKSPRRLASSINESMLEKVQEKTTNATPEENAHWTAVLDKAMEIVLAASAR